MKLTKLLCGVFAMLAAVCAAAAAQEYTSADDVMATADAQDFTVQGEYSVPELDQFFQVIARGDGSFAYRGDLRLFCVSQRKPPFCFVFRYASDGKNLSFFPDKILGQYVF